MKYIPFQLSKPVQFRREKCDQVIPPRYLYHLDYTGGIHVGENDYAFCKRLNIAKEGLYGKDKGHGGVWANVYQRNVLNLWPIPIDSWDWSMIGISGLVTDLVYKMMIQYYDVWRIDTSKIKNKWYLDSNLQAGEVKDLSKYLYTPTSVSGKALQLFHIELDMDVFNDHGDFIIGNLLPVKLVNDFIRMSHRRKRIHINEVIT